MRIFPCYGPEDELDTDNPYWEFIGEPKHPPKETNFCKTWMKILAMLARRKRTTNKRKTGKMKKWKTPPTMMATTRINSVFAFF